MTQAGSNSLAMAMAGSESTFACRTGQSLLDAMIEARRTGIKVGCRNGGCGVCRIRITAGSYDCAKMTRSRISEDDEAGGIVLACRTVPRSDIEFEPLPLGGV